jgi:hypothetical protein
VIALGAHVVALFLSVTLFATGTAKLMTVGRGRLQDLQQVGLGVIEVLLASGIALNLAPRLTSAGVTALFTGFMFYRIGTVIRRRPGFGCAGLPHGPFTTTSQAEA